MHHDKIIQLIVDPETDGLWGLSENGNVYIMTYNNIENDYIWKIQTISPLMIDVSKMILKKQREQNN